ncbi:MAG: hypothetical protein KBG15_20210, partial [Kofleriaceae bacterium]|nr:hypothetical protein [Kofleriaceae bacterium]
MIEATCTACGTANIFSDADIAAGAKYALCESCKAKVVLPTKATVAGAGLPGRAPAMAPRPGLPPMPKPSVPTTAGARPSVPAIPSIASGTGAAKPPPVPVKTPLGGGNAGDVIDLADLPAPKRMGGLAGAAPSRPAPASGLAIASAPAVEVADVAELPVPKRVSGLAAAVSGAGAPSIFDDVQALSHAAGSRQDQSVALDLDDLLAPVGAPIAAAAKTHDNLPAPKPKVAGGGFFEDLPAPRAAAVHEVEDLLAPKMVGAPGRFDDLPAPKVSSASKAATAGPSARPPVVQAAAASSQSADLLAPKGFFDDLPQPVVGTGKGSIDLPAPKGFFDDMPQPSRRKGVTDLPAPKGFFDELPQPARSQSSPDLPAPKGYFEDLPQLARGGGAGMELEPTTSGRGRSDDASNEVAPKHSAAPQRPKPASMPGSLFDDIPLPLAAGGATLE